MTVLGPGTPVPAFALGTEEGQRFTESDLDGHTTVLVFYPFAFSPVCSDQLSLYEEVLGDLETEGARLYGVSCDSSWAQRAFRERLGVSIPQLSDWEPKGATCEAFGVLHGDGFPERALVIVGPDRVVRWSYQAPTPGDLPGANLLFDGLAAAAAAARPV
ncbi:MAG TPA: redoxin domain-containing protein [Solirubrobacteraceae bacterium]|nr:redoxin domain-containing protein [Solirubrobacteraceae bacterium]